MPAPEDELRGVQQRILVIDDEAVIGLACKRTLCPEGHEVEFHEIPQAGLQAALSGHFDVVLLDLVMPGIEGMEILRQVKAARVSFRQDLFYRLNVLPIYLPPLHERQGDIPRLAMAFLERICSKNQVEVKTFTPEAMCQMESHDWPGNVRELRNIVERIAILYY